MTSYWVALQPSVPPCEKDSSYSLVRLLIRPVLMVIGTVIMCTMLGMALSGWILGQIFDLTGSYHATFLNGIFLLRRS